MYGALWFILLTTDELWRVRKLHVPSPPGSRHCTALITSSETFPDVRLQRSGNTHRPDGITCCSPSSSLGTTTFKPVLSFIWTFDATVFGEVPGYDRLLFTI
ncbi:hypothetical protein AB205_0183560 [Aquarana catesbeiana]|uniref:Uncharacterized protein n=1 Tax=Aquarana catesbeiana TaxID=8400 RepID=A0A2G9RU31_AQUCT|nr:hypothetical protein AB205_0183560 [Aquarana catesbeiana]